MTPDEALPGCWHQFISILEEELVPALGCTEPIAIAFAAAKARQVLGMMPDSMDVYASSNIIKNVKGVTVPATGSLRGIAAAALTGAVGGDPELGLEVLSTVKPGDIEKVRSLLQRDVCRQHLLDAPEKLHIVVKARAGDSSAEVEVVHQHTNIVGILKNGETLLRRDYDPYASESGLTPRDALCMESILDFARNVPFDAVEGIISRQIEMNTAISAEGLTRPYGARVGATLIEFRDDSVRTRAQAAAAAASDARMGGCELPVVTNSGSGNQGVTVSLPVIEYAKELGANREKLIRALVVSNLTAIYQKSKIGRLSAFCGAVSAAAGAGAGIAWLMGMSDLDVGRVVVSTIANTGGMVCDGAKSSCAAKIASAVGSALLALDMTAKGRGFDNGEGLVKATADLTIDAIGRMASDGMKDTDTAILEIMLEE